MEYTLTKERLILLTILAYLRIYPGDEGIGGKWATVDNTGRSNQDWVVGTRLRAPGGPLYNMPRYDREQCLVKLVKARCLEGYGTDCYRITPKGEAFLKRLPHRLVEYTTWYKHPSGWSTSTQRYTYAIPERVLAACAKQVGGSNAGWYINKIYEYEEAK